MKTETNPLSALDPLVTITELAEYLGVPVKTIYEWRQTGRGPVCVRIGRHLKFRLSDVQAWVDSQRDVPSPRSAVE
jgi:excisionase family DNA binding protein